jgi:hypothetical protein
MCVRLPRHRVSDTWRRWDPLDSTAVRALAIVPYAILILVAQAALDAMLGVVAVREGGMGIGSALILGQAVQVAAIPLGATAAALIVDRGAMRAAILASALLLAAGFLSVGMQPVGDLGWVLVPQAMAGAGFGGTLAASFAAVAGMTASNRPLGIAVLLLAALAARSAIGTMFLGGTLALTLAAATVVGLSALAAWLARSISAERSTAPRATSRLGDGGPSIWQGAVGGLLLAIGVFASFVGADPSRVTAVLLAPFVDVGSLEMLDALRAGSLVGGLALVVAGGALLLVRRTVDRQTVAAVAAILLAGVAASGTIAALTFAAATDVAIPGERAIPLVAVAALTGSALGILAGSVWLARRGRPRIVATSGGVVLASATVVGIVAVGGPLPQLAGPAMLAVLLASLGFGGGVVASALRLVLADSVWHRRGLAAAAGVMAASFGSVLGSLIGNGEGVRFATGGSGAISVGLLLLPAAAAAAAVIAARLVAPARTVPAPEAVEPS